MNKDLIGVGDVRLIDEHGEDIGVISVDRALFMARRRRLDLVEVNPKAMPPICKLLDFARSQYQEIRSRRRRIVEILAHAKFSIGVHGELEGNRATWQSDVFFADIRRAILATPLEHGTEFRLAVPGRPIIVVVSTSGPTASREPGKLTVYDGETVIKEEASRAQVVRCIENLLA